MLSVAELGMQIRARRMAQDFAFWFSKPQHKGTVDDGNRIAHDANAVVDAIIWLGWSTFSKREKISSFQEMYSFPAEMIWKARSFTQFIDVVNWKADITNWQNNPRYYPGKDNINVSTLHTRKSAASFIMGVDFLVGKLSEKMLRVMNCIWI
jgi:hypothetical protein